MKTPTPTPAGRRPVQGRSPTPAAKRAPVATPATANRIRQLANARLRNLRARLKTGRVVMPGIEADDTFWECWLRGQGMALPRDPTNAELRAAWLQYWEHQKL